MTGKHLIAGEWVGGPDKFASEPACGAARDYCAGTPDHVDAACAAAELAFASYRRTTRAERAKILDAIAHEIEVRGDEIIDIAS